MFTNETFHVIDWNPVPTICLIYYTCITCMVRMILTLNSLLCSFDSSWIWLFIRSQIDLRHEAICLEQFGENFINIANIRFPKPIHPYCKRDVLVETFEVCRFVYQGFVSLDYSSSFSLQCFLKGLFYIMLSLLSYVHTMLMLSLSLSSSILIIFYMFVILIIALLHTMLCT